VPTFTWTFPLPYDLVVFLLRRASPFLGPLFDLTPRMPEAVFGRRQVDLADVLSETSLLLLVSSDSGSLLFFSAGRFYASFPPGFLSHRSSGAMWRYQLVMYSDCQSSFALSFFFFPFYLGSSLRVCPVTIPATG